MTEEKIIPWEKLPITNTFMFNKVMTSDLDACRGVIETLLGIKISRVECVQDEKTLEVDALAKGVRFDVYVSNSTQVFDVELQILRAERKLHVVSMPVRPVREEAAGLHIREHL